MILFIACSDLIYYMLVENFQFEKDLYEEYFTYKDISVTTKG